MTLEIGSPSFDVVVIGGSQAGLAVGYHLAQGQPGRGELPRLAGRPACFRGMLRRRDCERRWATPIMISDGRRIPPFPRHV
jgi:hypothetical protein